MKRGKKNLICKYKKKKKLPGFEPMRDSKMTTTVTITS